MFERLIDRTKYAVLDGIDLTIEFATLGEYPSLEGNDCDRTRPHLDEEYDGSECNLEDSEKILT